MQNDLDPSEIARASLQNKTADRDYRAQRSQELALPQPTWIDGYDSDRSNGVRLTSAGGTQYGRSITNGAMGTGQRASNFGGLVNAMPHVRTTRIQPEVTPETFGKIMWASVDRSDANFIRVWVGGHKISPDLVCQIDVFDPALRSTLPAPDTDFHVAVDRINFRFARLTNKGNGKWELGISYLTNDAIVNGTRFYRTLVQTWNQSSLVRQRIWWVANAYTTSANAYTTSLDASHWFFSDSVQSFSGYIEGVIDGSTSYEYAVFLPNATGNTIPFFYKDSVEYTVTTDFSFDGSTYLAWDASILPGYKMASFANDQIRQPNDRYPRKIAWITRLDVDRGYAVGYLQTEASADGTTYEPLWISGFGAEIVQTQSDARPFPVILGAQSNYSFYQSPFNSGQYVDIQSNGFTVTDRDSTQSFATAINTGTPDAFYNITIDKYDRNFNLQDSTEYKVFSGVDVGAILSVSFNPN